VILKDILLKIKFDSSTDRIGPDCPFTHWRFYFKNSMRNICKKKFAHFANSAEFRAGAYAISCSKISIGENVIIRPNTMLFADPRKGDQGSIVIKDNVMIGSGVHIYVANHRYDTKDKNIINQGHCDAKNVVLEQGCWIGANSIILAGVIVGKNTVVGAGSVVTKNIPDFCVAVGNPARVIKIIK
jgi:acetyltransferase-like isoleucine patch superfamily enzyme